MAAADADAREIQKDDCQQQHYHDSLLSPRSPGATTAMAARSSVSATDDVYIAQEEDSFAENRPPRRASLPPINLIRPVTDTSVRDGAGRIALRRDLSPSSATSASTTANAVVGNQQQGRRATVNHNGHGAREDGQQQSQIIIVLTRAQVDAVERYRWSAFFIFLMYVLTFFAWPSYFMSSFGLATGLVGYVSCRLTQQGVKHNMASVIVFVACNYAMMVFLVWVFVSFFVVDVQQRSDGQPALVLLAVFIALGLLLHFRAQRVAKDFMGEFRAGVTRMPRPRRISITIARPPRRSMFVHDASSFTATTNVAQAA